jgi:hypothetical protein
MDLHRRTTTQRMSRGPKALVWSLVVAIVFRLRLGPGGTPTPGREQQRKDNTQPSITKLYFCLRSLMSFHPHSSME